MAAPGHGFVGQGTLGKGQQLEYESLVPPRENNCTIMQTMVDMGYKDRELQAINRVRKYLEAFFVSDLVNATGHIIESQYYDDWHDSEEGCLGKHRSRLTFGKEFPTNDDWKVWKEALGTPNDWRVVPPPPAVTEMGGRVTQSMEVLLRCGRSEARMSPRRQGRNL